jgi:hypothetical protein
MQWRIYVLKNPRTLEVRYVGVAHGSLQRRLRGHIAESVRFQETHKQRWVLSLVSIGLNPLIEEIDAGSGDVWEDTERAWIRDYRARGARLTNIADGGGGLNWAALRKGNLTRRRSGPPARPKRVSVSEPNPDTLLLQECAAACQTMRAAVDLYKSRFRQPNGKKAVSSCTFGWFHARWNSHNFRKTIDI